MDRRLGAEVLTKNGWSMFMRVQLYGLRAADDTLNQIGGSSGSADVPLDIYKMSKWS